MRYLLDTNILLRIAQPHDPAYQSISDCLTLLQPSNDFGFFLQNLSEFWNACTRPIANNGYGFSIADTDRRARAIESFCVYLPDTARVYAEWRELVVKYSVTGVQVHDAKLAAGMKAYGLTHLLTLNKRDFSRYAGLIAITPDEVIQNSALPNP